MHIKKLSNLFNSLPSSLSKKVQKINVKAIKMRHKKSISLSKKMSSQFEEREQTFFSFIVNSFIRAAKGDERKEGKKEVKQREKRGKGRKETFFRSEFLRNEQKSFFRATKKI